LPRKAPNLKRFLKVPQSGTFKNLFLGVVSVIKKPETSCGALRRSSFLVFIV